MDVEGIPVAGVEITGHVCWYCGKTVPRDDDADLTILATAVSPWELTEEMVLENGGYVWIHKKEKREAERAMHKAFNELMTLRPGTR